MSRLRPKAGHIYLENGVYRVWSSDGRPVNLLPISNRLNLPLTVTFPDFQKRRAYAFDIYTKYIGGVAVGTADSCTSFVTILPEDWASSEVVLAALPSGCNYVDVRVTLSRTTNPANRLGRPISNLLPPYQTWLPGGSCFCEDGGPWSRGFHIVISGSNIVLWRQQTVSAQPNGIPWNPGNAVYHNGVPTEGWTYSGGANAQNGHLASIIQSRNTGGTGTHRGGPNACSLNSNVSFVSTYTGTVQLWPGYIAA